ncbi:hypothetical protein OIU91_03555 [Streptomyces sp. NBC_01456]|uniref:hypothetical protein n=1 Tax=unclassified Streptomyces TaxID=2593676 RepID=UPI002E2F80C3|nr:MULTISPECIES: hypothetical protein [unclassified Streptomyces]
MPIPARRAAVVALAILATAVTGCSSGQTHSDAKNDSAHPGTSTSASSVPPGSLPTGPGPQSTYSVQQQPAPGSCHFGYTADKQPLPDSKCTPGATNPNVTPGTLKTTICRSGYTSGIRPPLSITSREKKANAASYGYTGNPHDSEYDHLVSLELGGDPNDARNLWVEPPSPGHRPGSGPNNPKDVVENRLKAAICTGKVELTKAQYAIAHDWTTAEATLGLKQ